MTPHIDDLAAEISARPVVYLLTVYAGGHPHAAQVSVSGPVPSPDGVTLSVTRLGATSTRNIDSGSQISLLWPPLDARGYTLIVNAQPGASTSETDGVVNLLVTSGVLHRPGKVPEGSTLCGSDCIRLLG